MKNKMILSAAVLLFLGACNNPATKNEATKNEPSSAIREPTKKDSAVQKFNFDTTTLKSGQTFYQCPMDLEVISDKAGACPICGMDLEANTKQ